MDGQDFIPNIEFLSGKFEFGGSEYIGRGNQWKNGTIRPGMNMILPNIFQGSNEWNACKIAFFKEASMRVVEPSEYNTGDFSGVLTDFAFPASLAPYALNDVHVTRDQYGLRKANAEELKLFQEYLDLIFSKGELTRIQHSKVSSVGATSFLVSQEFRKACVQNFYSAERRSELDRLADIITSWDIEMCNTLHFLPLYTQGTRKHIVHGHIENGKAIASKERNYITTQHILDHTYQLTKVDFRHPKNPLLFTYDVRSMYAAPILPNIANQIVNNFITAGLKNFSIFRYEGEIKLSRNLKERIGRQQGKLLSLDKSKFGDTFAPELVELVIEKIGDYFIEPIYRIVKEMIDWPAYFRTVERYGRTPIQNRPFEPVDKYFQSTFKSGNGLVSSLGQLIGGFDAVLNARDFIGPGFDLVKFLNNEYSFCYVANKGDDTLWWLGPQYKDIDVTALSLHKDQVEEFPIFLGYYYLQSGDVVTNVVRYFENFFCSERGIDHKTAPRLGARARFDLYKQNPFFDEYFAILKGVLQQIINFDYESYLVEPDKSVDNVDYQDLNDVEKQFLANPDLVYYKDGLLDHIRPELLEIIFSGTDVSVFEHCLRR